MQEPTAGRRGVATRVVTDDDTAIAFGSGDVPVLGTPGILALIEQACVACVSDTLPEGMTSVGTWAAVEHLAPSRVGASVTAVATLIEATPRMLSFQCEVTQADALVAKADHKRALVDRRKFMSRIDPSTLGSERKSP